MASPTTLPWADEGAQSVLSATGGSMDESPAHMITSINPSPPIPQDGSSARQQLGLAPPSSSLLAPGMFNLENKKVDLKGHTKETPILSSGHKEDNKEEERIGSPFMKLRSRTRDLTQGGGGLSTLPNTSEPSNNTRDMSSVDRRTKKLRDAAHDETQHFFESPISQGATTGSSRERTVPATSDSSRRAYDDDAKSKEWWADSRVVYRVSDQQDGSYAYLNGELDSSSSSLASSEEGCVYGEDEHGKMWPRRGDEQFSRHRYHIDLNGSEEGDKAFSSSTKSQTLFDEAGYYRNGGGEGRGLPAQAVGATPQSFPIAAEGCAPNNSEDRGPQWWIDQPLPNGGLYLPEGEVPKSYERKQKEVTVASKSASFKSTQHNGGLDLEFSTHSSDSRNEDPPTPHPSPLLHPSSLHARRCVVSTSPFDGDDEMSSSRSKETTRLPSRLDVEGVNRPVRTVALWGRIISSNSEMPKGSPPEVTESTPDIWFYDCQAMRTEEAEAKEDERLRSLKEKKIETNSGISYKVSKVLSNAASTVKTGMKDAADSHEMGLWKKHNKKGKARMAKYWPNHQPTENFIVEFDCEGLHNGRPIRGHLILARTALLFLGKGPEGLVVAEEIPLNDILHYSKGSSVPCMERGCVYVSDVPAEEVKPDALQIYTRQGMLFHFLNVVHPAVKRPACDLPIHAGSFSFPSAVPLTYIHDGRDEVPHLDRFINYLDHAWRRVRKL